MPQNQCFHKRNFALRTCRSKALACGKCDLLSKMRTHFRAFADLTRYFHQNPPPLFSENSSCRVKFVFSDAIASPSTYPCQWVGQLVIHSFRFGDLRALRACSFINLFHFHFSLKNNKTIFN